MYKIEKSLKNRFPELVIEKNDGIQVKYQDHTLILDVNWGLNESISEVNSFIRDINMLKVLNTEGKK